MTSSGSHDKESNHDSRWRTATEEFLYDHPPLRGQPGWHAANLASPEI
jgi:hypothetical protein